MNENRTPEVIGAEIRDIFETGREISLRCAIEIGRRLIEAKQTLQHGEWLPWLRIETDFSDRTAARYMKLFKEYGDQTLPVDWEEMNFSKALFLTDIPKDERDDAVKSLAASDMSVRELKEELRKRYGENTGKKNLQKSKDNAELKPCPFCGGRGELTIKGTETDDGSTAGYILVKCTICGATGKSNYYRAAITGGLDFALEDCAGGRKAIEAWNMRWKECERT